MNLKDIEFRLQGLIEVNLVSILPGKKVEDVIVQKLATAIRFNSLTLDNGSAAAPDVYTLIMNSSTAEKYNDPQTTAALITCITTSAKEAGFIFSISPVLTISTDDKIPLNDVHVMTSHRLDSMAETSASPVEQEQNPESLEIPINSYLIVEGVKVFPLTTSVVNIGRRQDHQIVIDDPRVSRDHAQLRAIKGQFVVFDLNSTGGTFINGQKINQCVLSPGDVISLAGVALIFGQDNPPPRPDLKDTPPFNKPAGEHPTANQNNPTAVRLQGNK